MSKEPDRPSGSLEEPERGDPGSGLVGETSPTVSPPRSQKLAGISHEVRASANALLGMTELLTETSLSPEQQQYLEIMKTSGSDLRSLLDDMVGLARVESQGSEFDVDAARAAPVLRGELINAAANASAADRIRDGDAAPIGIADRPADDPLSHRLGVLLVDDSAVNRMLIRSYLKGTPVVCEEAENGGVALEKFDAGEFDLVLMDIQMPVVDGLTAIRTIRQREQKLGLRRTPIIAVTASALDEDFRASLDAGADLHVCKPLGKGTLLNSIRNVMRACDKKEPAPIKRG